MSVILDFLGKLLSPSAEAVGQKLAAGVDKYLKGVNQNEVEVRELIFSYRNFDWKLHGQEYFGFMLDGLQNNTESQIASAMRDFNSNLNDSKLIRMLFSGFEINSTSNYDSLKTLQELGILNSRHFFLTALFKFTTIFLAIWFFVGFIWSIIQFFGGDDRFIEIFGKYFSDSSGFLILVIMGFFAYTLWIQPGYTVWLTKLGKDYYDQRILPNLVQFLRGKKI